MHYVESDSVVNNMLDLDIEYTFKFTTNKTQHNTNEELSSP